MKTHYRIFGYILGTLGMFLGFSNKIAAQYGVMFEENFYVNGQLISEKCLEKIPNATVLVDLPQERTLREAKTDANGNFVFEVPYYRDSIVLSLKDAEGKFLPLNYSVKLTNESWNSSEGDRYYIVHTLKEPLIVFVNYQGTPPCEILPEKEELTEETELVPESIQPVEDAENEEIGNDSENEWQNENETSEEIIIEKAAGMLVYPNPADNYFTVEFANVNLEGIRIEVYDAQGKLIYQENNPAHKENKFEICINSAPGTYLIVVKGKSGMFSERIIIQ